MVPLKDRLREALDIRNMKQAELCRISGIASGRISAYLTGRYAPKADAVHAIAKALNVNDEWLMGMNAPMDGESRVFSIPDGFEPIPESSMIPIRGTIACGEPITARDEYRESGEEIPAPTFLRADFALHCKGDSMTGARIMDGDIVLIKAQPTADDGDIVAGNLYGEATLKILYKTPDGITLQAANPYYKPIILKGVEAEDFRIFGIAVGFISSDMNQTRIRR